MRNRVVPVNPGTVNQLARRQLLTALSQGFRALTNPQRLGWANLGAQIQRLDSLGQPYTLSGAQAYNSVNFYRVLAAQAILADAPAFDAPTTLLTLTLSASSIALSLAFTPTPLGANNRLVIFATPNQSAGKNFFGHPGVPAQSPGLYKLIVIGAAATASPQNILAAYTALVGPPITGMKISAQAFVLSPNFLPGAPLRSDAIVA